MAPERRPLRENQFPFDIGVRGRKTGLTVPDTGIRDENGLEPMDHLFSSPEKPASTKAKKTNGVHKNADTTISSEEDMDVGESTIPEPAAVLTERQQRASMRLPPPRSKSPIKTFLQSPARRNPSLGPVSSPTRGSIVEPKTVTTTASVRRKLDFSNTSLDAGESSATKNPPQKRGGSAKMAKSAKLTNGGPVAQLAPAFSSDEGGDEEQDDSVQDDVGFVNGESSFQMDNGNDDVELEAAVEESEAAIESEEEQQPLKKSKGKGKEVEVAKPAAKKGRPKKADLPVVQEDEVSRPAKRTRKSLNEPVPVKPKGRSKKGSAPAEPDVEEEHVEERPAKRSRRSLDSSTAAETVTKEKPSTARPTKPKGRGKAKLATIEETNSPVAHRGPPLPRTNGLYILRKETPLESSGFTKTRSGRQSYKPLDHWRGERVEYDDDVVENEFGKFLMPKMKGIVRADVVADQKSRSKRPRSKSKAPKSTERKKTAEPESEEDEEELEPWETDPGRFVGEVRTWDPDDQLGSTAEEKEEEIALSAAAIITRDIAGATFRFAKTLTLPFFGAGMVDLPPGSMKKQKNSRKMQMAFFVFYGRVQVMVNDNVFRIGKGGMWQVPRGNFYSIENDTDQPARIFFSQGCEVIEEVSVAES